MVVPIFWTNSGTLAQWKCNMPTKKLFAFSEKSSAIFQLFKFNYNLFTANKLFSKFFKENWNVRHALTIIALKIWDSLIKRNIMGWHQAWHIKISRFIQKTLSVENIKNIKIIFLNSIRHFYMPPVRFNRLTLPINRTKQDEL